MNIKLSTYYYIYRVGLILSLLTLASIPFILLFTDMSPAFYISRGVWVTFGVIPMCIRQMKREKNKAILKAANELAAKMGMEVAKVTIAKA
jgi:hypothetical protein